MKRKSRRPVLFAALLLIGVFGFIAVTRGLYFFPTSVALGPCFEDWTSPSSYPLIMGERASPLETVRFEVGEAVVQVCYGRPSARERVIFGPDGLVPYGRYWRTGANEPTRLFTNHPIRIGDISIPSGRYSLYTIPNEGTWEVMINESTFHWGTDFSESLLAQEIGRFTVLSTAVEPYVETFTIRPEKDGDDVSLILEWVDKRIGIPIRPE